MTTETKVLKKSRCHQNFERESNKAVKNTISHETKDELKAQVGILWVLYSNWMELGTTKYNSCVSKWVLNQKLFLKSNWNAGTGAYWFEVADYWNKFETH